MATFECNKGPYSAGAEDTTEALPEDIEGRVDRSELQDAVTAGRPREARIAELGIRPKVGG